MPSCRAQPLLQGLGSEEALGGLLALQPFERAFLCLAQQPVPPPVQAQAPAGAPAQMQPWGGSVLVCRETPGQGLRSPGPPRPCSERSRWPAHFPFGPMARMQRTGGGKALRPGKKRPPGILGGPELGVRTLASGPGCVPRQTQLWTGHHFCGLSLLVVDRAPSPARPGMLRGQCRHQMGRWRKAL